jgi:NADH-quinone oxidoreductase subunit G
VLPRTNDDVNEEWISDKTRFAVDGLSRQRLDTPFVRVGGRLQPVSWPEAFEAVATTLKAAKPERIGVIAGDLQDAESMKAALDLFGGMGVSSLDCRQDGLVLGAGPRESWLFNSTIAGIEAADAVLLVGTNPRLEAAVLNARFRRMWLTGRTRFGLVGEAADLTYRYDHLGAAASTLKDLAASRADFVGVLKDAKRPAIVAGQGALTNAAVARAVADLAGAVGVSREGWNGWNVLHAAAARVGGLDLGFVPRPGGLSAREMTAKGGVDVLFLLGADELDLSATDAFVIYLGTHGDAGAHRADVILPGAAYTEKAGLYVNTEGRVQRGERAVFPKGQAREDWAILRALSERLGARLPYDTLDELRARLFADHSTFGQLDYAPGSSPKALDLSGIGVAGELPEAPLASSTRAFHLTNPVARASVTMAECAALAASGAARLAAE